MADYSVNISSCGSRSHRSTREQDAAAVFVSDERWIIIRTLHQSHVRVVTTKCVEIDYRLQQQLLRLPFVHCHIS